MTTTFDPSSLSITLNGVNIAAGAVSGGLVFEPRATVIDLLPPVTNASPAARAELRRQAWVELKRSANRRSVVAALLRTPERGAR